MVPSSRRSSPIRRAAAHARRRMTASTKLSAPRAGGLLDALPRTEHAMRRRARTRRGRAGDDRARPTARRSVDGPPRVEPRSMGGAGTGRRVLPICGHPRRHDDEDSSPALGPWKPNSATKSSRERRPCATFHRPSVSASSPVALRPGQELHLQILGAERTQKRTETRLHDADMRRPEHLRDRAATHLVDRALEDHRVRTLCRQPRATRVTIARIVRCGHRAEPAGAPARRTRSRASRRPRATRCRAGRVATSCPPTRRSSPAPCHRHQGSCASTRAPGSGCWRPGRRRSLRTARRARSGRRRRTARVRRWSRPYPWRKLLSITSAQTDHERGVCTPGTASAVFSRVTTRRPHSTCRAADRGSCPMPARRSSSSWTSSAPTGALGSRR